MSREEIEKNFLSLFDCDTLPNRVELFSFLKQNGLGGFVDENEKLKRFNNAHNGFIFCLPTSFNQSADFNEKLNLFLQTNDVNVILYWAQRSSSDPSSYTAWRIEIIKNERAMHSHTIDTLYWVALSLLISFVKNDIPSYVACFKQWRENNPSVTTKLLRFIPYIHGRLFLAEQVLTILKMDWPQKNITDRFVSARIQKFQPTTFLEIAVLSYILYSQDYTSLTRLPLIYALQTLTSRVTKNVDQDIVKFILFLLCQLFSTGCHVAFQLYSTTPGDSLHRNRLSEWMTVMTKEVFKIPIFMVGIIIFYILIHLSEKLLRQQWTNTERNQLGFRAMGFLGVSFFIADAEEKWIRAQSAENYILFLMREACKNTCELTIKSSWLGRFVQKTLSNQQTLFVEANNRGSTTQCTTTIEHESLHCDRFTLFCQSRFWPILNASKHALVATTPVIEVYPMQQYERCNIKTSS